MTRAPFAILVAILALIPLAGRANPVKVGGDVALVMREEAGGHRSPLAALGPRLNVGLHPMLELSAAYRFSFTHQGDVVKARSQYHRAFLRPELHVPFRASEWVLAAGPLVELVQTRLSEEGVKGPHASYRRLGVAAGTGIDFPLDRWTLRAGVDGLLFRNRWDVSFGLGGTFDLVGSRRR